MKSEQKTKNKKQAKKQKTKKTKKQNEGHSEHKKMILSVPGPLKKLKRFLKSRISSVLGL